MRIRACALALALTSVACGRAPAPASAPGVDLATQTISIGMLNDESGPASAIGRPWGTGLRVLARQINAGNNEFLPPGWKVQLVERDHAYNPARALQLFDEIQGQVLFIGTSFGTPNTLPLQPRLARGRLVAFPASLSTALHDSEFTPPIGPSYRIEAQRALDWMVEQAHGARNVKLGLVYQDDDYGGDGLAAVQAAAPRLGLVVAAVRPYPAGQSDFTEVAGALKAAGATHVMLTTMPSATAPILAAAAQLGYHPVWVGNSPAWLDRFYDSHLVPAANFQNFYWTNSFAYWGENVPMMKGFLQAYEKYGREISPPDNYIVAGYAAGLLEMEVLKRLIRSADLTREGFLRALRATRNYETYGATGESLDYTRFPYVTGTRTRVLKPDFGKRSWTVVGSYAEPSTLHPG